MGWPKKLEDFPQVVELGSTIAAALELNAHDQQPLVAGFNRCNEPQLGLYPVVDSYQWIEKLLLLGVKTVQLRIKKKHQTPAYIEQQIIEAIHLGQRFKAKIFINDHWALAVKHGAYGVHLGQEDLNEADLTVIKASGARLGISTHGYYEMLRAHEYQPSYLAFGAIFPTKTKDMAGMIQGVDRLEKYANLFSDYTTVAIGGISLERASDVVKTGVGSIAVVTAITEANNVTDAVEQLQKCIGNN